MPITPDRLPLYPKNWAAISKRIRFERAQNRCEHCGAENHRPHPVTGSRVVLTVAHLNHDPADNRESNLAALCQKCHNTWDADFRRENRLRRMRREAEAAGQLRLV